jgi:hypothetical protein
MTRKNYQDAFGRGVNLRKREGSDGNDRQWQWYGT